MCVALFQRSFGVGCNLAIDLQWLFRSLLRLGENTNSVGLLKLGMTRSEVVTRYTWDDGPLEDQREGSTGLK